MKDRFELVSPMQPMGDQPAAIDALAQGITQGQKYQTLLGVTGSGKTFTMANVIARVNKPTLVISHNKTLAAQLYEEFKELFPHNAVHYFVSYYDYYQPEAYIPQRDIYIEKDSSRNDDLDRLRLAATSALVSRKDVIIVASVSCIFGLGSPDTYKKSVISLSVGQAIDRQDLLVSLADLQYTRAEVDFKRGTYRVRGDVVELHQAGDELAYRIEFFGDQIDNLALINPLTGEIVRSEQQIFVYPAVHYVLPPQQIERAAASIKEELEKQVLHFKHEGKLLEAQRLAARTKYDLEMIQEVGFCQGIENYSRHLDGRPPGAKPYTLLDYFPDAMAGEYQGDYLWRTPENPEGSGQVAQWPSGQVEEGSGQVAKWPSGQVEEGSGQVVEWSSGRVEEEGSGQVAKWSSGPVEDKTDKVTEQGEAKSKVAAHLTTRPLGHSATSSWLLMIDESHVTVPQMRAMYFGDRHRKETLVAHGFRLPSALDNRPLRFEEIEKSWPQVVFVSATPGPYELERSGGAVVEQIIRPTGLVDPPIVIRPAANQVPDLIKAAQERASKGQRTLVTTLTKRLAEDLATYLEQSGLKARYMHSEIQTLDRVEILRELREGVYDVLVGVNLLREGLDLPEVALVAIMDADKTGFLRSATSLIQQIGRAARNIDAQVILYADTVTPAMAKAMDETQRRRVKQLAFNAEMGITPKTIVKEIRRGIELEVKSQRTVREAVGVKEEGEFDREAFIAELEKEMVAAAEGLLFEKAAMLRDRIKELKAAPEIGAVEAMDLSRKVGPKPGTPGSRVVRRSKAKKWR